MNTIHEERVHIYIYISRFFESFHRYLGLKVDQSPSISCSDCHHYEELDYAIKNVLINYEGVHREIIMSNLFNNIQAHN